MIVMKFGGSSLDSASAIERVVSIVRSHHAQHPVVVVSAMGKTTNRLLNIASLASEGNTGLALAEIGELEDFHIQQVETLLSSSEAARIGGIVAGHCHEISELVSKIAAQGQVTPESWDAVTSFGERLSSILVAAALAKEGVASAHLDARKVIVTDRQHTRATPLLWETYARVRRAVLPVVQTRVPVLGGFIAASEDGACTTLGRGGSDLTASLVGAALWADEIQIWTDVDGMLSCDPRVLPGGFCLRSISYEEAREMARSGAKVLHPETVEPAVRRRIPLSIRNSRRPWTPGTRIEANAAAGRLPVRSIASEKGMTLVHAQPSNEVPAAQFVQQAFVRHAIEPELLSKDEPLVLMLRNSLRLPEVVEALEGIAAVSVKREQAVLSLVGRNLGANLSAHHRALQALERDGIQVNAGGTSSLRFTFVVAEADLEKATACLHREFFAAADPDVFHPVEETPVELTVEELVAV